MNNKKSISDYTEVEFLDFVTGICEDIYPTEKLHIAAVIIFEKLTENGR